MDLYFPLHVILETTIVGTTLVNTTPSSSSTEIGQTTAPTLLTTLLGISSTSATTKRCEEMQAIDETVSRNISVRPNAISVTESIEFQPISNRGVSFTNNDRTPTIIVYFETPTEVQSVTIPRDKTPNANVQQFEVTFYSVDGKINDKPVLSNLSPLDDRTKPAQLDSSQIPIDKPVSYIEITIVRTTDGESPKGVILDIKACVHSRTSTYFSKENLLFDIVFHRIETTPSTTSTLFTTVVSSRTEVNDTTTITTSKLIDNSVQEIIFVSYFKALTTTTVARCEKENVLAEEFGLVRAESITETVKAETTIVGYTIRSNGTGWTPASAYSSLNIDFRYPIEVEQLEKRDFGNFIDIFFLQTDWSNSYNC